MRCGLRTPYCLVHGYECFREAVWVYFLGLSEDRVSMSSLKPRYPPIRLPVPQPRTL